MPDMPEVASFEREVVVLGAGIAGLSAAYRLRDLNVEVVDSASWLGGRTRSLRFAGGMWANLGAQYLSADKTAVIDLADELGIPLVPNGFEEAAERGRGALSRSRAATWRRRSRASRPSRPIPATRPRRSSTTWPSPSGWKASRNTCFAFSISGARRWCA